VRSGQAARHRSAARAANHSAVDPSGDAGEFTVSRDGLLIVERPITHGGRRKIQRRRSFMHRGHNPAQEPPAGLADPLQDIRVNQSTAQAYFGAPASTSRSSLAGRQCTDFQRLLPAARQGTECP
jgi:hypothetical protein